MASKSTPGGFYDYIQKHNHHDVWRIIVLVFVLVIVVVVAWVYSSYFDENSPEVLVPVAESRNLTDVQRQEILTTPSGSPVQNPSMSDVERRTLLAKPASSK